MVKKIYFKKVSNSFQDLLRNDLSLIKRSEKAFIVADKTRNLYELDKQSYDKLLTESVTKIYKKDDKSYITTSTSNPKTSPQTSI